MKKPRKPKAKSYRTLKIALDRAFSLLVRLKASVNGRVACVSCGASMAIVARLCE